MKKRLFFCLGKDSKMSSSFYGLFGFCFLRTGHKGSKGKPQKQITSPIKKKIAMLQISILSWECETG